MRRGINQHGSKAVYLGAEGSRLSCMLAVPLPFAPNQNCFATVSIYTISHGTTRHGIEYHLHVRPKGNIPPRKTADYMLLTRSKLKKHTESPCQKSHATGRLTCARKGPKARAPGAMNGEKKGIASVAGLLLKDIKMLPALFVLAYRALISRCCREPMLWPRPKTGRFLISDAIMGL